ncbi:DUF2280 domain-containing protein [Achromobacter pestifer]|uniref:DUF2280 domain-containing protein n=1 Tax=Achromobacter pestifer TaxID=1353889 RepID=A0A7D4I387_9BURK|nr:DUF2280 domain-containing protein [Achromobacter pestifer]QKH38318.1 DUF2280 domain-containing protein [Achromobacter pestifer]
MAKLTGAHKRYIIQALACWDTPKSGRRDCQGRIWAGPRMLVAQYDPTKVAGQKLAKKWADLFETTRRKGCQTTIPQFLGGEIAV